MARRRLDQALVDRGLADSRSRARRLVLAGQVRVDGEVVDKPATAIADETRIRVETSPRYVSRGGDKLDPVLAAAGIAVERRVCIDLGASTGGFTDCLLQHGAALVVAVDVGYGQLDWKLRNDDRVLVMERRNARHLRATDLPETLPGLPDLAVMDVSFIGAAKLLPALGRVTAPRAEALLLVKPQFEAGPERVESGGVVRDPDVRRRAVTAVAAAARAQGWSVVGAYPSPLRGPAGNWECFLYLRRGADEAGPEGDPLADLAPPDDRGTSGKVRRTGVQG